MAAAVGLRADFIATDLQRLAQSRRDGGQVRRLLVLAVMYNGGSRSEAARTGGVGLQTVRDWVLRFSCDGPNGLINGKASEGRPRLDANQRAALAAAVESGPIPAAHGVVRWRLVNLVQWIRDEFAVSISTQTLSRELRAMGYRKLTARPRHHAQDVDAIPAFKKTSPSKWQRSGRCSPTGHP
jgi:transposase